MDPFQGLAKLILGKLEQGVVAAWLKFLFELIFSGVVTYLFAAGGVLAGVELTGTLPAMPAADLALVARGVGMVSAAISLTALFRREANGLTKGMLVALPSAEAAKELQTDLQYIQKPGEKK